MNRSCPQCRCGTLHVVAHAFASEQIGSLTRTQPAAVDSSPEGTMLRFVSTRLAAFTASPTALRQRVPRMGSPYVSKTAESTIRVDAALEEHSNRDQAWIAELQYAKALQMYKRTEI